MSGIRGDHLGELNFAEFDVSIRQDVDQATFCASSWEVSASISVPAADAEIPGISLPDIQVETDVEGYATVRIFDACGAIFQMSELDDYHESLSEALDFDGYSDDFVGFRPEMVWRDDLETFQKISLGARLISINKVLVAPAWRGHGGVGQYLLSRSLRLFATPLDAAILLPHDFEEKDAQRRKAGNDALRKLWRSEGFKSHKGHDFMFASLEDHYDLSGAASRHLARIARQQRKAAA